MNAKRFHLAIDIGASSGRHIVGYVEDGRIMTEEVYRFDNRQVIVDGHECWDLEELSRHILEGLRAAADRGMVPETVGIDTWGVDFVLVNEIGIPVTDAVSYRDSRTDGMPEELDRVIPFDRLYAKCGIQRTKFNTIYQLFALKRENPEVFERAARLLMVPDYLNFVLTGKMVNEYTIASTTSLVNACGKDWDWEVVDALELPRRIFGEISMPGVEVGPFTSAVADYVGFNAKVVLPATHDTGSAFLSVPEGDDGICISSGTWSLIGIESKDPITTPAALAANFTNEGGAWGRFRFIKNIMGLWMVQSIRRELNGVEYVDGKGSEASRAALERLVDYQRGKNYSYADLEAAARASSGAGVVFNVNDMCFLNPASMIGEVMMAAEECGGTLSRVGDLVKSVYASLAASYAEEVRNISSITGKTYRRLNIVGGGSRDGYLNELAAESTGLELAAGPVEGTVIGNLIVQMVYAGIFENLAAARRAIVR